MADIRTDTEVRPDRREPGLGAPERESLARPALRSRHVPPRGTLAAIAGTLALIAGGALVVADLDDGPSAPVAVPVLAEADTSAGSLYAVADQVRARDAWLAGATGAGVNVAVIDTGVAVVPALAERVVATVDLSPDAADPERAFVDGHGHGTHMAGIVAGRTPGAVPGRAGDHPEWFMGMAPDAGIVSVKVSDGDGYVAPGSLLAGLDWVAANADLLDIGVAVLAFDAGIGESYLDDPVAAAAERVWAADVVVVAAAGNGGAEADGLSSPAPDPYVIAVGGVKIDDVGVSLPEWASRGDDVRRPDVAAPGAHIRSLRAPGSDADVNHETGYVDEQRFLNSGSSPAAAVVAGVAALVRSADPSLTADEVKAALVAGAAAIDVDPDYVGAGLVDATGALEADLGGATQTWDQSTATAPFASARVPLAVGMGNTWSGNAWSGNAWSGNAWSGNAWSGNAWSGNAWSGNAWSGNAWSGNAWS